MKYNRGGDNMLKNLIVIENDDKYQYDNLEELVKGIIDKDYYNMTEQEKLEKRELKAFANCLMTDVEVVNEIPSSLENKFVNIDEVTYIYSLLRLNKVVLLESTNSNFFTKYLDKSNITDNYIIVNHFAEELLKSYIERR